MFQVFCYSMFVYFFDWNLQFLESEHTNGNTNQGEERLEQKEMIFFCLVCESSL